MIITTLINKYESVLDLFSFTPLPRFQGRETVSSRGVLGTFLLFVTMIVYISMTSQRFLSMTPSVSMNQSPTSAEPVQFLESGITFRINDAFNVPRQFFFNASYFQYYMAVTNVFQQDMEPREITPIEVVPCNLQWAGLLGSNSYCPETTPMLLGRYQSESYTFFRIDVVMCSPAFPFYNQTTGEVIPCEDMTTIMDTLARGRFNFLVNRPPTISEDPSQVWDASFYVIDPSVWSQYEGSYTKVFVSRSPDYFSTFSSTESTHLIQVNEKYLQRPTATSPIGGQYVLTLYARLSGLETHQVETLQTSLDLIGSWAAFYGAVFGGLALYFSAFNEDKFYNMHPKWDNFDVNFVSAVSSTKQVDIQLV